ncbi:MAG: rhodanese-like domain-containing protein [Bacteroidota bacterium]
MSFFSRPSTDLSPAEFVANREAGAPVLDVRTPAEFAEGHLAGAVNADVMAPDFHDKVSAMDLPSEGPIYLYCRSGNRSGSAAGLLKRMGHQGALNVGGFEDLAAAGAKTA